MSDVTTKPETTTETSKASKAERKADTMSALEASAKEAEQIAAYNAFQTEVVELAIATLDPKDALRKYAALGAKTLKLAKLRKDQYASWNGTKDLAKVCNEVEELVRMRVPINEVEIDKYVRIHAWLVAVRPIAPSVDKLSFHVVKNILLSTLSFDADNLTGEIKKEWLTWLRETVETQTGDNPATVEQLKSAKKEAETAIKSAKSKKLTDEQQLDRERKEADTKSKKERRDAHQKIADSVDAALTNNFADTADVAQIVESIVKANGLALPAKWAGFDAQTCTAEDCKKLASAMAGFGKLVEMKTLQLALETTIKAMLSQMTLAKSA